MYNILFHSHKGFFYLFFGLLIVLLLKSIYAFLFHKNYTRFDEILKTITVSIGHLQLLVGIILYFTSPITKYFFQHFSEAVHQKEFLFFGLIHIVFMLTGIILLTIGSVKIKQQLTNRDKLKTLLIWFGISFIIIFLAIPWPFSPYVSRLIF